jgi:hypothetical protein
MVEGARASTLVPPSNISSSVRFPEYDKIDAETV